MKRRILIFILIFNSNFLNLINAQDYTAIPDPNFEQALIDENDRKTAREIKKIMHAVGHRPINKNSEEFYNFLTAFQKKITELESKFTFINLKLEKAYFDAQIDQFKTRKGQM